MEQIAMGKMFLSHPSVSQSCFLPAQLLLKFHHFLCRKYYGHKVFIDMH